MSATPLSDRSQSELLMNMLMYALRGRDLHLNAVAAEFLYRQGERAMPILFGEVTNRRYKPAHRVRVLEIIARIGPPFGEGLLSLGLLQRDRNQAVREATRRLFGVVAMLTGGSGE